MDYVIWILLSLGPALIARTKDRSPAKFFLIALGASGIPYFFGWGFMTITSATAGLVRIAAVSLGLLGMAGAYALSLLATSSERGKQKGLGRRSPEMQCPNCAGFVLKVDRKCKYCGFDLT